MKDSIIQERYVKLQAKVQSYKSTICQYKQQAKQLKKEVVRLRTIKSYLKELADNKSFLYEDLYENYIQKEKTIIWLVFLNCILLSTLIAESVFLFNY